MEWKARLFPWNEIRRLTKLVEFWCGETGNAERNMANLKGRLMVAMCETDEWRARYNALLNQVANLEAMKPHVPIVLTPPKA